MAFSGALANALANGNDLSEAVTFAVAAGAGGGYCARCDTLNADSRKDKDNPFKEKS